MVNYGFAPSKMDGTEHKFKEMKIELPEAVSYKEYLPKVLDQGNRPICVPCSVSAYINWNLNLKDGVNDRDNGVDYEDIYSHRTTQGDDGMTFKDAFHYLRHNCCKLNDGCEKTVDRYALVGSEIQLKQALLMNGPCVGGLPVYDTTRDEFWYRNGDYKGGHAISIVGYNKDGFIIRNSWGRWYGDNGYAILPYDDFNYFMEVWSVIN